MISDPCRGCHGERRVERERSLCVKIPAGVDTGACLRLAGEGEHGRHGGPPATSSSSSRRARTRA